MNNNAHGPRLSGVLVMATLLLSACTQATSPAAPVASTVPSEAPAPTTAPTSTREPSPVSTPAGDTSDLSVRADAIFSDAVVNGAFSGSVLIARDGQVILDQGYGYADRESKTPNTPTTRFRISTLSEQFTAVAILHLQDQGKLSVRDRLCVYVADCPDSWQEVTLHELLTHSAGLREVGDYSLPVDGIIERAKSQELLFQPGDRWSHSALGYDLLGKVIEAVSGQSYDTYLQESIFGPLKMENTGYVHGHTDLASVYFRNESTNAEVVNPQGLFAAAGLFSTVEDLFAWDQALYTDELVSPESLDSMFTGYIQNPHYPTGMKAGYGGFTIVLQTAPRLIEGSGYMDGVGSVSVVHRWPDDKIVVIVLANQQDVSVWDFAAAVNKELFGR